MTMQDALTYWGWRIGSALSQRVPVRAGYAVASIIGELAYLVWRSKREIAKHNFAGVVGARHTGRRVARIARRSFREFAKYIFEIMRFPSLEPEDFRELVEVRGAHYLEQALAKGRGIIFVSCHFGNFELGGARIAGELRPLNVVADDLKSQRLFELLIGHRADKGITIITPEGAGKKVLSALRRNELVGLMMDLGPRAQSFDTVRVRFCGRETTFPAVAANLARVSGAPIIVGCVVRRSPDEPFLGIVHEPIFVERTKQALEDIQHGTQRIVADIERFVTSWPEQWYIFRPMWPVEGERAASA